MSPGQRLRAARTAARADREHQVVVELPGGNVARSSLVRRR
jgi:hypothetical protein